MARGWSEAEIAEVVGAYFALLSEKDQPILYSRIIAFLRSRLDENRTETMVRLRFAHISRVLEQADCAFLQSYPPKKYVQRELRLQVERDFLVPLQRRNLSPKSTDWSAGQSRRIRFLAKRWQQKLTAHEAHMEDVWQQYRGRQVQQRISQEDQLSTQVSSVDNSWTAAPTQSEEGADREQFEQQVAALLVEGILERPSGNAAPGQVIGGRIVYQRLPSVVAWTLQQANGLCELCGAKAPFFTDKNQPYLEAHHLHPLSKGGADTPDNMAALCPNCHRRVHYASDAVKVQKRLVRILAKRERIQSGHTKV